MAHTSFLLPLENLELGASRGHQRGHFSWQEELDDQDSQESSPIRPSHLASDPGEQLVLWAGKLPPKALCSRETLSQTFPMIVRDYLQGREELGCIREF